MECYDHGLVPDRKCKTCRVVAAQIRRAAADVVPTHDPRGGLVTCDRCPAPVSCRELGYCSEGGN